MARVSEAEDALPRGQTRIQVVLERVPDNPDELKAEAGESRPIPVAGLLQELYFVMYPHFVRS
jgi:hypothetical protein